MALWMATFDSEVARKRHPEWESNFREQFRLESCDALAGEAAMLLEQMTHAGMDLTQGMMIGAVVGLTPEGFENYRKSFAVTTAASFVLEALIDVMEEKCGANFDKVAKMIVTVEGESNRQFAETTRGITQ